MTSASSMAGDDEGPVHNLIQLTTSAWLLLANRVFINVRNAMIL